MARIRLRVRWRMTISFARHQFPPAIIRHAVWLYMRFTLSYRDVEDLLAERGLDISYETVRRWVLKFGPLFARELRRRRPRPTSRWHLDESVPRTYRRRFGGWTYQRATARRGRWGFPRSPIASLRWWSNGIWSRWWSPGFTPTLTDTGPANRRSMRSTRRGSDAGVGTGSLISTSRPSSTASKRTC